LPLPVSITIRGVDRPTASTAAAASMTPSAAIPFGASISSPPTPCAVSAYAS